MCSLDHGLAGPSHLWSKAGGSEFLLNWHKSQLLTFCYGLHLDNAMVNIIQYVFLQLWWYYHSGAPQDTAIYNVQFCVSRWIWGKIFSMISIYYKSPTWDRISWLPQWWLVLLCPVVSSSSWLLIHPLLYCLGDETLQPLFHKGRYHRQVQVH